MECFCICKRRAIVFSGVCCKKLKSIFSVSDGEFREYRASFTQSAKPSFLVPRTPSTFGGLFFEGKNIVCRRHSSVRGMSKKKKNIRRAIDSQGTEKTTDTYIRHTRRTIDVKFSIFLFIWYENCWRWTDHVDLPKHRPTARTHAKILHIQSHTSSSHVICRTYVCSHVWWWCCCCLLVLVLCNKHEQNMCTAPTLLGT